jgi:hypothetical protein
MKNIKEQLKRLLTANSKTDWTKGVFWAIFICFVLFSAVNFYLLFRPLSKDMKNIIDKEVNSSNIIFDQKTIDVLKNKGPGTQIILPGGKNPFTSL